MGNENKLNLFTVVPINKSLYEKIDIVDKYIKSLLNYFQEGVITERNVGPVNYNFNMLVNHLGSDLLDNLMGTLTFTNSIITNISNITLGKIGPNTLRMQLSDILIDSVNNSILNSSLKRMNKYYNSIVKKDIEEDFNMSTVCTYNEIIVKDKIIYAVVSDKCFKSISNFNTIISVDNIRNDEVKNILNLYRFFISVILEANNVSLTTLTGTNKNISKLIEDYINLKLL